MSKLDWQRVAATLRLASDRFIVEFPSTP